MQQECTFSNGTTIGFGSVTADAERDGTDVWQAGDYEATEFRVNGRLRIPSAHGDLDIRSGSYTLFVDTTRSEPWTLIISNKGGQAAKKYPGEQYDLGRAMMGFDDSWRPPVQKPLIGCTQAKSAPIFIYMESGKYVAYAKIMAMSTRDGKDQFFWY